jgi:hypothetical protein
MAEVCKCLGTPSKLDVEVDNCAGVARELMRSVSIFKFVTVVPCSLHESSQLRAGGRNAVGNFSIDRV